MNLSSASEMVPSRSLMRHAGIVRSQAQFICCEPITCRAASPRARLDCSRPGTRLLQLLRELPAVES